MTITYRSPACADIFTDLADSYLFLDTTSLISAFKYPDFAHFLIRLNQENCRLFTLPSAAYEFTRMAKNNKILAKYEALIDKLSITIYTNLEAEINTPAIKHYLMLYNDCVNKNRSQRHAPSFTDSLFCIVLYLYRHSSTKVRLMTANYTDVPIQFFDKTEIITIDAGAGAQVENIYSFNNKNYTRLCHQS